MKFLFNLEIFFCFFVFLKEKERIKGKRKSVSTPHLSNGLSSMNAYGNANAINKGKK